MKLLIVAAIVVGLGGLGDAQPSGGSLGGGGWSGGGGGGGGTGMGVSDDGSGGGSSGPDGWKGVLVLIAGGVGLAGLAAITRSRPKPRAMIERHDTRVGVVRVAVGRRKRVYIQRELARIARSAQPTTSDGRYAMLHEVALVIRRARDAWAYGGTIAEGAMARREARTVFAHHTLEARAMFVDEQIRNAGGVIVDTGDREAARSGLVLVSVVIATRGELFELPATDRATLDQALRWLENLLADELIAIDVVWSPADVGESMSSIALEARLPPGAIVALEGAIVGSMICAYCRARYPAEQLSCTRCGGHASATASPAT